MTDIGLPAFRLIITRSPFSFYYTSSFRSDLSFPNLVILDAGSSRFFSAYDIFRLIVNVRMWRSVKRSDFDWNDSLSEGRCEELPHQMHRTSASGQTNASERLQDVVPTLKPNTHRRRRRDETVLSRRVGVGGVYMNSTADGFERTTQPSAASLQFCSQWFTPTTRRNCRQLVANSCTHRRRDATRQFRLVGVGGVYWALGLDWGRCWG